MNKLEILLLGAALMSSACASSPSVTKKEVQNKNKHDVSAQIVCSENHCYATRVWRKRCHVYAGKEGSFAELAITYARCWDEGGHYIIDEGGEKKFLYVDKGQVPFIIDEDGIHKLERKK